MHGATHIKIRLYCYVIPKNASAVVCFLCGIYSSIFSAQKKEDRSKFLLPIGVGGWSTSLGLHGVTFSAKQFYSDHVPESNS
jgi:hypothetical protein